MPPSELPAIPMVTPIAIPLPIPARRFAPSVWLFLWRFLSVLLRAGPRSKLPAIPMAIRYSYVYSYAHYYKLFPPLELPAIPMAVSMAIPMPIPMGVVPSPELAWLFLWLFGVVPLRSYQLFLGYAYAKSYANSCVWCVDVSGCVCLCVNVWVCVLSHQGRFALPFSVAFLVGSWRFALPLSFVSSLAPCHGAIWLIAIVMIAPNEPYESHEAVAMACGFPCGFARCCFT